jgi:hypothetical protein
VIEHISNIILKKSTIKETASDSGFKEINQHGDRSEQRQLKSTIKETASDSGGKESKEKKLINQYQS